MRQSIFIETEKNSKLKQQAPKSLRAHIQLFAPK